MIALLCPYSVTVPVQYRYKLNNNFYQSSPTTTVVPSRAYTVVPART